MAVQEGASILQTPSYIVAVLLLLFSALFFVFEKLIHWRTESLRKRNKMGLLAATEAMTTELMLFGIAALLLSVFEDPISKICIPAPQGGNWYMMSELDGCPCCLKDTRYITECWMTNHTCGLDFCSCDNAEPSCMVEETSSSSECLGQEEASQDVCGSRPGYKQALSELAIHEIHLWVFWIGLVHIVSSSFMIRISTWRLDIWKKWMIGDNAHIKAVHQTLEEHAAQLSKESPGPDGSVDDGKADIDTADAAVVSAFGQQVQAVSHSARSLSAGGRQSNLQRAMSQLTAADSMLLSADLLDTGSSHESHPPAEEKESQQGSKEVALSDCPQVAVNIALPHEVVLEHAKAWQGRAHTMERRRQHGWEWLTCVVRQFAFHPVSHVEMSIMRASFVLTHRPGKHFKFTDYILASMDEDFAKVVGLGAPAWFIISIFVLVSGLIVLAVVLTLGLNTKLVYIARHSTRGGRVHRLEPGIFWFGSDGPWVMLVLIKAQLFLVAFIYTSQVFFAVTFGPHSCFFVTPGFNSHSLPIPWWVVLILNSVVYAMLCFVTLPLYSLGVHMGADFKRHILPAQVQQRMLSVAHNAKMKERQRQQQEVQQQKKASGVAAQRWRHKILKAKTNK